MIHYVRDFRRARGKEKKKPDGRPRKEGMEGRSDLSGRGTRLAAGAGD